MESETKNTSNTSVQACQNCKSDFVIEPEPQYQSKLGTGLRSLV